VPRRICRFMSDAIVTLTSWAGCLWLGFQIGNGLSEHRRKADINELERRFKIVDCKVVGTESSESAHARP
jgi:hypothetical protein